MSLEDELIKHFESLGLEVNTNTKARGNQGFYIKNRIDISKNTPSDKIVTTLLHEFAHYIHSKIEPDMPKTGGSFKVIFKSEDDFTEELLKVTNFVDKNSLCEKLLKHKSLVKIKINELDKHIKLDYPKFQRSKKFTEFEKATRGSRVRHLLSYDIVKVMPWFFGKPEILSVQNIEKDFPNLKPAFVRYIRLKSLQRKQSRITSKINKMQKYYSKPTELFARFIEGLYQNKTLTISLAPNATSNFFKLVDYGYYVELENVLKLTSII